MRERQRFNLNKHKRSSKCKCKPMRGFGHCKMGWKIECQKEGRTLTLTFTFFAVCTCLHISTLVSLYRFCNIRVQYPHTRGKGIKMGNEARKARCSTVG